MKFFKYILIIAIIGAVAYSGLMIADSKGKINVEIEDQTGQLEATVTNKKYYKVIYTGEEQIRDVKLKRFIFTDSLIKDRATFINVKITAVENYELVAFDKEGNRLGVITYLNFDDGLSDNGSIADFDLDNYIIQNKYFYIVAEKIVK